MDLTDEEIREQCKALGIKVIGIITEKLNFCTWFSQSQVVRLFYLAKMKKILNVFPSEDPGGGKLHFRHKVPVIPTRKRDDK